MTAAHQERVAVFQRAIKDPGWQRQYLFRSPLYAPQIEAIKLVERHALLRTGKTLTIRSARQTMKNECSGMLQLRAFYLWQQEGGTYIRTAPTWRPQIVNSKLRLERFLRRDPLMGEYRPREGYIYEVGNVQVMFLSTDKNANAVGATADIALDIDEAHKVDRGKFEEDFAPMVAWKAAPVVMWGVAADKQDLLYEYRQSNIERGEPDLNLQYPASVWCELRPEYARRYTEHRDHLGADHPVIMTQYDLVDVDALGGYLKPHHLASLFSGDHPRLDAPEKKGDGPLQLPATYYVAVIDIGGEDEDEELDPLKKATGARDSTTAMFFAVDTEQMVNGWPMCRLAQIYWWTGKAMADRPSGLEGQQSILMKLLHIWRPRSVVVDARGIGEQMAKYLKARWPNTTAYTATVPSITEDCFGLLAMINNGSVKVFRDDGSPEYKELRAQARRVGAEIRGHEQMTLVKPKAGETRHMDLLKAMTYLPRALGKTHGLNLWV